MRRLTQLLVFILALASTGCGFHLRGTDPRDASFNFKTLYIKSKSPTPFVAGISRALTLYKIEALPSADKADLTLEVVSEQYSKQILSLSGAGRVQEYLLTYRVTLHAYDSQLDDWLATDDITLTRIQPYDDQQVLAMMQEETMLRNDMINDAVVQAVHRLNRAKHQP